MNIYDAKTYRAFVNACLDAGGEKPRRGAVKRLAAYLKCHSTYVSQVTSGKADLSVDQGLRLCRYFEMPPDQTEFFLDLLCRDRAATKEAKSHYQMRIDRRLEELSDMKKRWKIDMTLTAEQELKYYSSWIPQAVHLYCQLPGTHTQASIAQALGLAIETVAKVVSDLESLGFIELTAAGLRSLRDLVHLGKDSEIISRLHVNWRLKAITDLTTTGRLPGTHYSSVVTMDEAAAVKVQALIHKHLDETRAVIVPAPSEDLFVFCLDFYPLRKALQLKGSTVSKTL